jgi:hypothetical protein
MAGHAAFAEIPAICTGFSEAKPGFLKLYLLCNIYSAD